MKRASFPEGWNEERVRRVLEHYERQSDEEAVAEDEAAVRVNDAHRDGHSGGTRAGSPRTPRQAPLQVDGHHVADRGAGLGAGNGNDVQRASNASAITRTDANESANECSCR